MATKRESNDVSVAQRDVSCVDPSIAVENVENIAFKESHESSQGNDYVVRGLSPRQFQFMAFGAAVGTGLFLSIGIALNRGGPLSLLLGYTITSLAVYAVMQCLGEMGTWLPIPGAIPTYCSRFVDDALGFAVGWNTWYTASMVICTEASAAAIIIEYWTESVNPAVWISLVIIMVVLLNIFAVSVFGEAEFVFSIIKLLAMLGLLITTLVIDLGGAPTHDRIGFRYWKDPGAMREYIGNGAAGRFTGWFATLIAAAFTFGGSEGIIAAAGEAKDAQKNIPKAMRRVFLRIVIFYVLGSFAVGLIVPYTDPRLLSGGPGAAASPWVLGIVNAGIPVLPSIINAVILLSAISVANYQVFCASRYLFSLAQDGQAPKIFTTCSKRGIPYYAVAATSSVSLLTYMTLSNDAQKVFLWFMNINTFGSLLTWMSIAFSYLRFRAAIKAQGVGLENLPFKTPLQPYAAYFGLTFFAFLAIGNGYHVFIDGNWSTSDFIASYIGLPIYISFFTFWKVLKKTKWVSASNADLWTIPRRDIHQHGNAERA